MKNILIRQVGLSLLLALVLSHTTYSQMTDAQRNNLLRLSEQYKKQYAEQRKEAEAFALQHQLPLKVFDSNGQIIAILDHIENGQAIYVGPDNVVSQASLSADEVKTGGGLGLNLTGAGQRLGLWEAGGTALDTHQEFGGRLTNLDATASSDHATHVAGTMIAAGVDPGALGFSEAATIRCYDSGGDNGEMAFEAAAPTPILVSNHSYSSFAGWYFDGNVMPNTWRWFGNAGDASDWQFGAYNSGAQAWDNIAFAAPFYLIVKSAGNDRNDNAPAGTTYTLGFSTTTSTDFRNPDGDANGYDCIPTEGNAKNILTVGAVNPVAGGTGYTGPNNVTMSGFSGWGPTDDGRLKPDVVADGVGLYSASNASNTAYSVKSGTSMAAPSTSGTIGLLLEHWQNELGGTPRSATMKALLINEADEIGANNGPDYSFGWGQVNAADAAQTITFHNYIGCDHIVEGSVAAGSTFSYTIKNSGTQPLKITLVWVDPASGTTNGGTLNPAGVNYLVNDLDLRLDDATTTYLPWVLDPANPANAATTGDNNRDNIEQILVLNPSAGTYTIRVVAPAALTSGPQQFSLVISGNDATIDNATYSGLTISDNRTYAVRQNLTLGPAFVVTNPGDVKAYAGHSIKLVPGFHAKSNSRFLARILPGGGCGIFTGDLKADNYPNPRPETAWAPEERQQMLEETSNPVKALDFQILPNPTSDFFSIRFEIAKREVVSLQLLDALGKSVYQWYSQELFDAGEHIVQSDNLPLAPGIYFVEFRTSSGKRVQKLVKSN